MLARVIESLGIPTVTVTMIPELALKTHASRVVGVEFPFGHSFGNPGNDQASASSFLVLTGYSTSYTPRKVQVGARFEF